MRDIEADYRRAVIDEYESLVRGGRGEEAAHVAQVLRKRYGHEVEPQARQERTPEKVPEPAPVPAPERADAPVLPENAAEPQPKRRGPAKKTAARPVKE